MAGRETRIPKGLVPHRRSGIHRGFSYIAHNRRNVRFKGLWRDTHHPIPEPRTQRLTGRNKGVSSGGGITTLGPFCAVQKPCVAGCQNGILCRFRVLVGCAPEECREPAGQRCAYARRCSAGVAAPLGCVIFFVSAEIGICTSGAHGFPRVRGTGGITTLGALCVLLKCRTAACQKGSFAVF